MVTERNHPKLAATLAALALLWGCAGARRPEASPRLAAGSVPRTVRVASADRSLLPVLSEVVGTVRSAHEATIAPLVGGTVAEVRVGLGSFVRAGQVLVRLSAREGDERLEQARAMAALAASERDRAVALNGEGTIAASQYEAAVSQWSVARAREAEARTIAGRALLRAPFAGVITARLVNAGETVLPGRALLTLEGRAATRFEAQVPEAASGDLAVGRMLAVRVEGQAREIDGRIIEIQPASDDATRARLVKLDLPETQGLRSGQFGRVLLANGVAATVTVPAGAVVRRGQLEAVFVVDATSARLRLVRCGREADGRVQISSGLSGGEKVVVAEASDLADGQPVEVAR
jgi:RND family efflux transporter MFP subunit